MALLAADFHERAASALKVIAARPPQMEAINREVDGFFAKYPALDRTRLTEAFITALVIEGLTTAAPAASQPQTKSA